MVCRFITNPAPAEETSGPQNSVDCRRTEPVFVLEVPVAFSVVTLAADTL